MPSGKGSIQEPRRAIGSYMRTAAKRSNISGSRRGRKGAWHGSGRSELGAADGGGGAHPRRGPALGGPAQQGLAVGARPDRAGDPRSLRAGGGGAPPG